MTSTTRDKYLLAPLPHEHLLRALFVNSNPLVIFDVGACEGEDSVRYLNLFPNSHVFAFEPVPRNIARMESLFQHHGSHNLHAVPFALSNVSGAASLYCSSGQPDGHDRLHEWDFGNKSSSLLAPDREKISAQWKWLQFESELTVQTTTIHSFCAEHNIPTIDYIHLDVQGAELLALEGAGSLIDTVTAIWLEVSDVRFYKNQPVRPEVYSFLRTRNFTMVYQSDDDVQPNQLFVRDSVLSTRKIDLGHRIQDEGRDAARTTPSTLLCKLRKIASIASLFRGKTGSEISERGA